MKVNKNAVRDAAKALANYDTEWESLSTNERKAYKLDARVALKGLHEEAVLAINDIYRAFEE